MAEDSVDSPVNPEITHYDSGNSRRDFMGKSSNSGEKSIPHYLRASTGSCHDFCKYGRKPAFEDNKISPMRRSNFRKSVDIQILEESVVVREEKKKTSRSNIKDLHMMKANIHDSLDTSKTEVPNRSPDNQNLVENEVLLEKKKNKSLVVEVKLLPYSSNPLPDCPEINQLVSVKAPIVCSRDPNVQVVGKKKSMVKPNSSPKTETHMSDPSKPKSKARLSNLPKVSHSKSCLSDPPKVSKSKSLLFLFPKAVSHRGLSSYGRGPVLSKRTMSKGKDLNLSETHGTSFRLNSVPVKPFSPSDPLGGSSGRKNTKIKRGKRSEAPTVSLKKEILHPTASSLSQKPSDIQIASMNARNNKSPKVVLHQENQNKIRKAEVKQSNNGEIQEKTMYVIKMETENFHSESDKNQSCVDGSSPPPSSSSQYNFVSLASDEKECGKEYEYAASETDDYSMSEDENIVSGDRVEILEAECKGRQEKAEMVYSEEEDNEPVKLNFRRGKVVDFQSENNGSRKLKFRRGRVLSGNQNLNSDACRKTFMKTEFYSDTNGTKSGSEKVVLRHQYMQDKKDAQGLFNNVIEETASKLVESRKSKVKALVGAFETVISLQ